MSQMALLQLLIKVLLIVIIVRLALTLIPMWVLALIGLLVVFQLGLIDPQVVQTITATSSPLLEAVLPFLIIILVFAAVSGRRRKK